MGSGHSSRRNGHRHQTAANLARPPWIPPPGYHPDMNPPVYTYYYHPQPVSPQFFQQGYYLPANGHYYQPPAYRPYAPPPAQDHAAAPAPPAVIPEYQKTSTVRNDVNLNKSTLKLERDETNPGLHMVSFSFDATAAGSITVFFMAKEYEDGKVVSLNEGISKPGKWHFKSGLGQKYKQETGVDLSLMDVEKQSGQNVYGLIVRIETVPKDPPSDADGDDEVGGALRKWIHCQQTYASVDRKDGGEYNVKVVKQIIWVDGIRYELQEIYGIANNELSSSNDCGKECVICMSEPKDTTLLPCRHMCMCSGCANVLRYQTNRCPICRCPVEELLQIKVPAA